MISGADKLADNLIGGKRKGSIYGAFNLHNCRFIGRSDPAFHHFQYVKSLSTIGPVRVILANSAGHIRQANATKIAVTVVAVGFDFTPLAVSTGSII